MPHQHGRRVSRLFVDPGLPFVGDQMVTARFAAGFCIKNAMFGSLICLWCRAEDNPECSMRETERGAIHLCSLWRHLQAGVGCREASVVRPQILERV